MRLTSLDLGLVDDHPANPREKLRNLPELAASIAEIGVRQPIAVRESPLAKGRYQIEAGHRRVHAARMAGLTEIPAVVFDDADDAVAILALLATQHQHDPFTPAEENKGMQGVLQLGNLDRAAKAIGLDPALLKAAQRGRAIVDRSKLEQASLAELAALSEFEADPDTLAELEKQLGKSGFEYRLREARAKRERLAEVARLVAAGVRELETAPPTGAGAFAAIGDMLDGEGEPIADGLCEVCAACRVGPAYSGMGIETGYRLYCDLSDAVVAETGHRYRYYDKPAETPEQRAEREAAEQAREQRVHELEVARQLRVEAAAKMTPPVDPLADWADAWGIKPQTFGDPALVATKGDSAIARLWVHVANDAERAVADLSRYGDSADTWAVDTHGPKVRTYYELLAKLGYRLAPTDAAIYAAAGGKQRLVSADTGEGLREEPRPQVGTADGPADRPHADAPGNLYENEARVLVSHARASGHGTYKVSDALTVELTVEQGLWHYRAPGSTFADAENDADLIGDLAGLFFEPHGDPASPEFVSTTTEEDA